ncbi:MAG: helix-turn-helix domain-containing protein [Deltaproteobacteria bacterium]|nr:helix-turn-helix domain-containing protein [Deltaproteobacteria bacterium]
MSAATCSWATPPRACPSTARRGERRSRPSCAPPDRQWRRSSAPPPPDPRPARRALAATLGLSPEALTVWVQRYREAGRRGLA